MPQSVYNKEDFLREHRLRSMVRYHGYAIRKSRRGAPGRNFQLRRLDNDGIVVGHDYTATLDDIQDYVRSNYVPAREQREAEMVKAMRKLGLF